MRRRTLRRLSVYRPDAGDRAAARSLALAGMRLVAKDYEITLEALKVGRGVDETYARQLAIYLAVRVAGLSYSEAAALFAKHRQSVWVALKRVAETAERSDVARRQVARLTSALKAAR